MVYNVKHNGWHKARLVSVGHLTESVYSGVVSLRGIQIVVFLARLNGLQLCGANVGKAYLEAMPKKEVYIVCGPEFDSLEGHIFLIAKSLYGLLTSGLRWHQRFAGVLRSLGFVQIKAEADIWMRKNK
jgi:Reverse transcriptase (RNA-dependent DNA polymerase)